MEQNLIFFSNFLPTKRTLNSRANMHFPHRETCRNNNIMVYVVDDSVSEFDLDVIL